ncbi:MAG: xanthine dehydrogenase family protein molybdopterin-binding subunit [Candidatus Latescibacteria bacterium]|nr:xanthine dehydrogenase family protein molybdopterin-binding subunit [Candidatus Latescibacterota bacterium]
MAEFTIIGTSPPRSDGVEKVTGAARYVADIHLPGMLYGRILRSPYPHARIIRVDVEKTLRLPGVKAVATANDLPEPSAFERPVFAYGKVRFKGEPIAAVAATDPDVAADALDLIEVDYEPLPAVMDPEQAMRPEAPLIHDDSEAEILLEDGTHYVNITSHSYDSAGDVEAALEDADVVVEGVSHLEVVHQGYLEPQGAIASVDLTGTITVWSSTQGHFWVRQELSRRFRVPMTKITVIPATIGGGFGGKVIMVEPTCVLLARKAGRPVRIIMSREEDLTAANPAPRCIIEMKSGATKDGMVTARKARLIWDTGAYPGGGGGGIGYVRGPYRIPNVEVDSYVVYTNKTSPGAYRAPGFPQITFACESQMDEMAKKIGIDPVEFRLKNLMEDQDFENGGEGPAIPVAFKETLQRAADLAGWREYVRRPYRGRGVAIGRWDNWAGPSSCAVMVNDDGTIRHVSGAVDLAGTNTSLPMIVAEELGVALEDVAAATGDTATATYATVTGGSRVVYGQGSVAKRAAQEVKEQLLRMASEHLEVAVEDLEVREKTICVRGAPDHRVTFTELATLAMTSGPGPITGTASISGLPAPPVIAAQIVEVEVDPETGEVKILTLSAAQDVGRAIHRASVEGQIQGGMVQGLGWGLCEQIAHDPERGILNPHLLDYQMLTAADVPAIRVALVECPSLDGPFGAKGVGEPPIIPTPAAVANAVYDAIGVRITDLPITPERIVKAMK